MGCELSRGSGWVVEYLEMSGGLWAHLEGSGLVVGHMEECPLPLDLSRATELVGCGLSGGDWEGMLAA